MATEEEVKTKRLMAEYLAAAARALVVPATDGGTTL